MTEKLIRDHMPTIATRRGRQLDVRVATPKELPTLLRAKIREEAEEVFQAGPDDLLEELADTLEVIHALTLAAGHSIDELHQARAAKAEARGGFTQGLVLCLDSSEGNVGGAVAASHPTAHLTDALRENADALRDLGAEQIAETNDPLAVVGNLYATLEALREAWPAIATAAGFDGPELGDDPQAFAAVTDFTDDIRRGLNLIVDGLWNASNNI